MEKKILVADEDLDVHELLHDILHINFRRLCIDRALNSESFVRKIGEATYDLILLNTGMKNSDGQDMVAVIRGTNPELMDRIILVADAPQETQSPCGNKLPSISKPFSLDDFGQIIKEVCCS
jgi:DNA-binding NtrC family response regulator